MSATAQTGPTWLVLALDGLPLVLGAGAVTLAAFVVRHAFAEFRQLRRETRYATGIEPTDREVDRAFRALVRHVEIPADGGR